jgi:flagellar protein FlbT
MSLTIRLKPDEKIIIGGAVIKNGSHSAELHVENKVPILRRKDIMSESEAVSPARRIYFEIQLMYIDVERRDIHLSAFVLLVEAFLASQMPDSRVLLGKTMGLVSENDYYHALKMAKELIVAEDAYLARL